MESMLAKIYRISLLDRLVLCYNTYMPKYTCSKCGKEVGKIYFLRKLKKLFCDACVEWAYSHEDKMKKMK